MLDKNTVNNVPVINSGQVTELYKTLVSITTHKLIYFIRQIVTLSTKFNISFGCYRCIRNNSYITVFIVNLVLNYLKNSKCFTFKIYFIKNYINLYQSLNSYMYTHFIRI